jgi:hypothetical protein
LTDLLRGAQQESRGEGENGKKQEFGHVWPQAYTSLRCEIIARGFRSDKNP